LNSSISPANNTTSFISGGGANNGFERNYGATPGGAYTARTLDSSYDAHYAPNNLSKDVKIMMKQRALTMETDSRAFVTNSVSLVRTLRKESKYEDITVTYYLDQERKNRERNQRA
jgi:hypothetical protein